MTEARHGRFPIGSSGPSASPTRRRRCGRRSRRPKGWAPGSARRPPSTCGSAASRQLTWDGGHTAELRIERLEPPRVFGCTWAHLRPARGRPAPDLRRVHAGAGRRGHPADRGRDRLRAAARATCTAAPTTATPRAGRGSWTSSSTTSMPERDQEAIAEEVFAALADPTRRGILAALAARGPATATDLASRAADHPAGDRQAPRPADRGRPGRRRARRAAPGPLPAALGPHPGRAAVPGRAGPGLGLEPRRAAAAIWAREARKEEIP